MQLLNGIVVWTGIPLSTPEASVSNTTLCCLTKLETTGQHWTKAGKDQTRGEKTKVAFRNACEGLALKNQCWGAKGGPWQLKGRKGQPCCHSKERSEEDSLYWKRSPSCKHKGHLLSFSLGQLQENWTMFKYIPRNYEVWPPINFSKF